MRERFDSGCGGAGWLWGFGILSDASGTGRIVPKSVCQCILSWESYRM